MERLLRDLNDDQRAAVTTVDGPLLVIAGAGSGKTRVLTRRLAYILTQRLAQPHQLLAVTFTNKAAGEMQSRIAELLGGNVPGLIVSTFHSFCARFLRQEAHTLGYTSRFTVYDADDSETLVKNCIKDLHLTGDQFTPKAQLRKISGAKDRLIPATAFADGAAGYFEQTTAQIYTLYQSRLRECDAMDFDDLLFNAVLLLRDNSETAERYRRRFHYLMVDEYQDTNHSQYVLLRTLTGEHHNICVVGDEDQSIYGWRGADIRNILEFERDFPGAKIIKLEQNYRSTELILSAASAVIKNNEARKAKTLWTEISGGEKLRANLVESADDEARIVVSEIEQRRRAVGLNDMVVLYRTNAQSRPFEEELRRRGLPYQIVGGISFYQRREIKDLVGYLKLIVNIKDDVSCERVVNYPKRGVGDKTVDEIRMLARRDGSSNYEVLLRLDHYPSLASRRQRLEPFVALIEKFRTLAETMAADLLVRALVGELKLVDELLAEDKIIGQTRVENIDAFIDGVAEYSRVQPTSVVAEYLAGISLFTDIDAYDDREDKLTLMTLHSAKGLEFDTVFIVGLEEGLFPLQRTITEPLELEEERRLFYVGATRAEKLLYLSAASKRYRGGEILSRPSRFLKEIPEHLLDLTDLRPAGFGQGVSDRPSRFARSDYEPTSSPKGVHYEFDESDGLAPGRIVQHPTFGRGRIVHTEGYGDSLTLEIQFAGVGAKKIMPRFVRLRVIG